MSTPTGFELGTDGVRTIVVGVDGSEPSMRAASFAAGLARREGSRLMCVYVQQSLGLAGQNADAAVMNERAHCDMIAELKRDLIAAKARWGTDAVLLVRRGDPTKEIAKLADEVHADTIVVGRSMKIGHERLGSTGGKLVRAGRWPVSIVP